MSGATDWQIVGQKLALRLPSGQLVLPTASEIIGAEFKNRLTLRGETILRRPSESLAGLRFARYPLDIALAVIPPSDDLQRAPQCALHITAGSRRLTATVTPGDDQVILAAEWFPLATDMLAEIDDLLRGAGIPAPGRITLKQYLQLRRSNSDLIVIAAPGDAGSQPEELSRAAVALPASLNATLYGYQRTGFAWLCGIAGEGLGCILADEMGLGKTLQIIALLVREQGSGAPCLVVAPATLLENWRREIARFAPGLSTELHRGHERTGFPKKLRSHDVVITSYETAVRDMAMLQTIDWNVVVLDEAQAIKTPAAQRTIAIKQLPRRIGIPVTGTPLENRLRDLWSLMDFAVPGLLGSLTDFEARYADSVDDAGSLEPLVTPLILRRRVAEVAADLPERIEIPQPIELSPECAMRYDALRAEIAAQYGSAASLVALTKLRMFCAHPLLLDSGAADPAIHSTKYVRLCEVLDEIFAVGEKVLIFTSYTTMADILVTDIAARFRVPCELIDGRTPVVRRQAIVDRFGELSGAAALVLNPKAAGTGLNITAANHVVHYNLEWNPAVEDQGTARAHRRGQTLPVTVHRLFHSGTVEEVIDQRMQRKRALASTAVVGTEGEDQDLADIVRALQLSPVLGVQQHVP